MSSRRELIICETDEDVADAAADLLFDLQTAALAERGIFRIALSGGSTPKMLYETLADDEWVDDMQWDAWEVYWSDERCVPPDSADSNFRLAHEALLAHVPVADIFRVRGDSSNPVEAAAEYARTLATRFGPGTPVFDVILLGMGPDGHTASLFPDHPVLKSSKLIEAVEVDQPVKRRVTFTLNLINQARCVILLVTGETKAGIVRKILRDGVETFPAAQVDPDEGTCYWLLDHAAASLIR